VAQLGGNAAGEDCQRLFNDLVKLHSGRSYHNWGHITRKLGWTYQLLLASDGHLFEEARALLSLADFYHDAIYDTVPNRSHNNEEASATLATSDLVTLGVDAESIAEIARLIRLTRKHQTTDHDLPGQIMIDSDLAVFGASSGEYRSYAEGIRVEYGWVDTVSYIQGRSQVLKEFLARKRLFFSPLLDADRARQNISEELERLSRGQV